MNIVKPLLNIILVTSLVFLTGCVASGANKDNMVASYSDSNPIAIDCQSSKFHKKLALGNINGGKETHPLLASKVSDDSFKAALEQSLANYSYISETPEYRLDATLLDLDQPWVGFKMTVKSAVRYNIVEINSGQQVYEQTINAAYTANFTDHLYGASRLRLANEGSVKTNIELLIKELGEIQN